MNWAREEWSGKKCHYCCKSIALLAYVFHADLSCHVAASPVAWAFACPRLSESVSARVSDSAQGCVIKIPYYKVIR